MQTVTQEDPLVTKLKGMLVELREKVGDNPSDFKSLLEMGALLSRLNELAPDGGKRVPEALAAYRRALDLAHDPQACGVCGESRFRRCGLLGWEIAGLCWEGLYIWISCVFSRAASVWHYPMLNAKGGGKAAGNQLQTCARAGAHSAVPLRLVQVRSFVAAQMGELLLAAHFHKEAVHILNQTVPLAKKVGLGKTDTVGAPGAATWEACATQAVQALSMQCCMPATRYANGHDRRDTCPLLRVTPWFFCLVTAAQMLCSPSLSVLPPLQFARMLLHFAKAQQELVNEREARRLFARALKAARNVSRERLPCRLSRSPGCPVAQQGLRTHSQQPARFFAGLPGLLGNVLACAPCHDASAGPLCSACVCPGLAGAGRLHRQGGEGAGGLRRIPAPPQGGG